MTLKQMHTQPIKRIGALTAIGCNLRDENCRHSLGIKLEDYCDPCLATTVMLEWRSAAAERPVRARAVRAVG